ncbi:MAG TPA: dienelactone hydrolase family protein [Caulobacteraceae bacterium]|nr:dienelactone hydrolase family protein [Caulobacteraceae bacterium]
MALALPIAAPAAHAQGPAPAPGAAPVNRGNPNQTWADQQKEQAWATQKLDQSPRRHEWVSIPTVGGRTIKAFVTYPQGKPKAPVVVVLHEVFGLTDSTRNTADEISAMGYITVTPDMLSGFAPNGGGTSDMPTTRVAGDTTTSIPDPTVDAELNDVVAYGAGLPQSTGKVGIVGLSWGGGAGFRYAAWPMHSPALKLVCVFYDIGPPTPTQGPAKGAGDPPISVAAINVPVYGFYGETDKRPLVTIQASKDAMAAAGKTYDPVIYPGADHAFMRVGEDPRDKNPNNAPAVKAALARLKTILASLE